MVESFDNVRVFSGSANPDLARAMARKLGTGLGGIEVGRFADGEIRVKVEESVRGKEVFVIQSICRSPHSSVNDSLVELLIMLDAFKRASARRVVAVIPYYAYARQDRKIGPREPISARLVADLITAAGAERIVTMDLHALQIQGFFNLPVDNVPAGPAIAKYLDKEGLKGPEVVIVSPDVGGVGRATKYADDLKSPLAIVVKRRLEPNEDVQAMEVIGDVEGRVAVIVDDMIDTGKSLVEAVKALVERGAKEVYACCTHPVLSEGAVERVEESPVKKLVVTDTIPVPEDKKSGKIEVLPVAPLLAEAIKCICENKSMSERFKKYW